MSFDCMRAYLEIGYFVSQITLALIAFCAAIVTYRQWKSFKMFELLKYIESKEARSARLVVMRDIQPIMQSNWWDNDNDGKLRQSAADVAALYDVIYMILHNEKKYLKQFFFKNWAYSIVRSHEILQKYLEHRRGDPKSPRAYDGFSKLAKEVEIYINSDQAENGRLT